MLLSSIPVLTRSATGKLNVVKKCSHNLLVIKLDFMFKKLFICLFGLFGFSLLMSQNTFALSDQHDLSSSNQEQYGLICGFSGKPSCEDFKYITLNWTSSSYNSELHIQYNTSSGSYEYPTMRPAFSASAELPSGITSMSWGYNYVRGNDQVSVIFSDTAPFGSSGGIVPSGTLNISENGTFDVTNYASAVVDVEQIVSDLPPYSKLVVDSFWQYHTAFAGSVVALIAIFLVYRLLKGRLR